MSSFTLKKTWDPCRLKIPFVWIPHFGLLPIVTSFDLLFETSCNHFSVIDPNWSFHWSFLCGPSCRGGRGRMGHLPTWLGMGGDGHGRAGWVTNLPGRGDGWVVQNESARQVTYLAGGTVGVTYLPLCPPPPPLPDHLKRMNSCLERSVKILLSIPEREQLERMMHTMNSVAPPAVGRSNSSTVRAYRYKQAVPPGDGPKPVSWVSDWSGPMWTVLSPVGILSKLMWYDLHCWSCVLPEWGFLSNMLDWCRTLSPNELFHIFFSFLFHNISFLIFMLDVQSRFIPFLWTK